MYKLELKVFSETRTFLPGEQLKGEVTWTLPEKTGRVDLRLFWATSGRGIPETGMADTIRFDHPAAQDTRPFVFQLPTFPFSFEGRLMRLNWAVEAVAVPGELNTREEFVLAPERKPIILHSSPNPVALKAAA